MNGMDGAQSSEILQIRKLTSLGVTLSYLITGYKSLYSQVHYYYTVLYWDYDDILLPPRILIRWWWEVMRSALCVSKQACWASIYLFSSHARFAFVVMDGFGLFTRVDVSAYPKTIFFLLVGGSCSWGALSFRKLLQCLAGNRGASLLRKLAS